MHHNVAEDYLMALSRHGVEFLFANAGTDFAPIIEGYVALGQRGVEVPRPVIASHENVAISMAIGSWMVTGRMQACMVHVNVGTANAVCGLLNAARGSVPVLFTAGRTPITESGQFGSRNLGVHWTQEMFDQAGMVREAVKWEYELRSAVQLEDVVQRAIRVANAYPKGPVYLTLPREILAQKSDVASQAPSEFRKPTINPPSLSPDAAKDLLGMIARSKMPLLITSQLGYDRKAASLLGAFIEATGVAVVEASPSCVSLSSEHPLHAGYDPHPLLADADLILVMECPVPWIPDRGKLAPGAKVIHIGVDPLFASLPMRSFECDMACYSTAGEALEQLIVGLQARTPAPELVERRKKYIGELNATRRKKLADQLAKVKGQTPIHPAWAAHCIGECVGEDTILLRESPQLAPAYLNLKRLGSSYSGHFAGGLGWGLGAAIGAKLAAPEATVIAVEGDGSYIFSTPIAAHHSALENGTPFLTIIMDNHGWNEVHAATTHVYPSGNAASANKAEPLTYFSSHLRLERAVETVGGTAFRVEDPKELRATLEKGLEVVRAGRQAVVSIVCSST